MSEITKKWYVVRIIGNKEKIAKEYIEKEMGKGMLKHITDVLVPTEKYFVIKNGKRVSAERNFSQVISLWKLHSPPLSRTIRTTQTNVRFEKEILGIARDGLRELPNIIGFTEGRERVINPCAPVGD